MVISQSRTLCSDGSLMSPKLSNAKITLLTSTLLFQIQWTKLKTHPICLVMFLSCSFLFFQTLFNPSYLTEILGRETMKYILKFSSDLKPPGREHPGEGEF